MIYWRHRVSPQLPDDVVVRLLENRQILEVEGAKIVSRGDAFDDSAHLRMR